MKKNLFLIIAVFFLAKVDAATIYLNVKNVNGTVIPNAFVKLYNSDWSTIIKSDYTNDQGIVTFALLDYGTYNYEVYYTGDAIEFWGSGENVSLSSPTLTINFTRFWPYRFSDVTPSSSVLPNTQVSYNITVKNLLSFSRNVKVEIWVDKDKLSSWDYHQLSNYQTISSNGTKTFSFNFTPTTPGMYNWKMQVLSYNDGAGDFIVTDSYFWSFSFAVFSQTAFPLTNGGIVYHSNTKEYATLKNTKLFLLDFSTNSMRKLAPIGI